MNINESQSTTPGSAHPWEKFLPSKRMQRIIMGIIVIVIIIGIGSWIVPFVKSKWQLSHNKQAISEKEKLAEMLLPQPTIATQPTQLSVDKDTDNDRIPDWQETLIGTNPTIANSESDVPIELRQVITDSVKTGMITTDDKLALKIYQRLAQDPKGQDFAQAIQAATAKEILDLANSLDKGMTSYGLDDLNISDGTLENNTIYIKQTKSLLKDASIPQDLQEKIYTYLMQGGEKNFGITTYQTKIGSIVGKLLETPVSVANANYYLQMVNALAHMNQALSHNSDSPSDQYANSLVFQKNLNIVVQFSETITP